MITHEKYKKVELIEKKLMCYNFCILKDRSV